MKWQDAQCKQMISLNSKVGLYYPTAKVGDVLAQNVCFFALTTFYSNTIDFRSIRTGIVRVEGTLNDHHHRTRISCCFRTAAWGPRPTSRSRRWALVVTTGQRLSSARRPASSFKRRSTRSQSSNLTVSTRPGSPPTMGNGSIRLNPVSLPATPEEFLMSRYFRAITYSNDFQLYLTLYLGWSTFLCSSNIINALQS